MNSCNDNLREVFKLINSLASINNTKHEAEQAKMFVKENWDEFRRDFESTSTKRYSTGEIERDLFKLIANVCDWKTNKDNMRIASQIMILCEYNSYKINKDRFKQKIQNILNKEKSRSKIEGKKRKRTNKKKEIESDISVSINQDIKGISSSIDQETDEQQTMINHNVMNEQQQIFSENTLINKDCRSSDDEDSSVNTNILDFPYGFDLSDLPR